MLLNEMEFETCNIRSRRMHFCMISGKSGVHDGLEEVSRFCIYLVCYDDYGYAINSEKVLYDRSVFSFSAKLT